MLFARPDAITTGVDCNGRRFMNVMEVPSKMDCPIKLYQKFQANKTVLQAQPGMENVQIRYVQQQQTRGYMGGRNGERLQDRGR
eukprot:gene30225-37398_t